MICRADLHDNNRDLDRVTKLTLKADTFEDERFLAALSVLISIGGLVTITTESFEQTIKFESTETN